MIDSHAQLEAWLVDGAMGDPPREIAVHATLCESCAARLGAFDALALVDVGAAGSPPPLAPPTRLRVAIAWARRAAAAVGAVVAGILVVLLVLGISQLLGSGGSAGRPEGTELSGVVDASDQGRAPSQRELSTTGPAAVETPTSSEPATAQPGFTPGPVPSLLPAATPPPPTPSISASPTVTPTPAPPPTDTPSPTPESPSPTPEPSPNP